MISQPCDYSSVSTRKIGNDGASFIMIVPAFMVRDNRVSLYVEDPAPMKKAQAKESLVLRRGFP